MSLEHTGKIVTRGLVLYVNGINEQSAPVGTTWKDRVGGNDMTLLNGPTYTKPYVSIDNTSSNAQTANNILPSGTTEATIEAWFKWRNGAGNYECVLHCSDYTNIGQTEYWLGVTASNTLCATIGARTGIAGTWSAGDTGITASLDTWYHLVCAWRGTRAYVFLDGEYIKDYSCTTFAESNGLTRIGASGDGNNYQFKGDVGAVRIYNVGLTDAEILQNYNLHKNLFS